jgi:hypothetical protein
MRGLLIFFVMSSVVAAGTIEDSVPDSRYVDYGSTYSLYTRKIVTLSPDGKTPTGTCVLISPHWCLTAAHVVEGGTSVIVDAHDGPRVADHVEIHHEYKSERYNWHDIALVHVAEPFSLPRYPPLIDKGDDVGSLAAVAGYGMTGPISTGYDRGDGLLRAGTCVVTSHDGAALICLVRSGGSPLPLCIAPGDSGGPLFIDGRLAGINSFTRRDGKGVTRSRIGEESGHIRVSLYLGWIRSVAGELDGDCMLSVCKDATATP